MKTMKTAILALLILPLLLLSGCSNKTPQNFAAENGLSMGTNQAEINACLVWMAEKETAERAQYDSLPATEKGYALMHRETMSMVKSVWGKESNVCKPGTNGWDAYIVAKQEEERTKRQYSSDLSSTAKFGIVTTGAVKLADALLGAAGDKIAGDKTIGDKTAGDKTTSGRDSVSAGGDVVLKGNSHEQTTKNDSNVQVSKEGDNNATVPKEEESSEEGVVPAEEPVETVAKQ